MELSLIHILAKVARKDKDGKRVKEVVDGKKVTVYDEVAVSYTHLDVYKRQG